MRKVKVFYFILITIFFLYSKVYSQEIEFVPHTIVGGEFAAQAACSVYAIDVDGDSDMDVLSASAGDDKITWYENDGEENFNAHTITTSAYFARSVYAADVDGDGDMDVLSASTGDDKIAWYENDGDENFTAHTITTGADGAHSVYADDVDGDGDVDVLSASTVDDKIAWYENDEDENFTAHTITTSADGAISVYAADVDGDGDMDVLSASFNDNKIAWYENLQIIVINEENNLMLKNFPNPFEPSTTISFSIADYSNVELTIYNIKGQKVRTLFNEVLHAGKHSTIWNGRDSNGNRVSSGIYFYKLKAGDFQKVRKMLLVK